MGARWELSSVWGARAWRVSSEGERSRWGELQRFHNVDRAHYAQPQEAAIWGGSHEGLVVAPKALPRIIYQLVEKGLPCAGRDRLVDSHHVARAAAQVGGPEP